MLGPLLNISCTLGDSLTELWSVLGVWGQGGSRSLLFSSDPSFLGAKWGFQGKTCNILIRFPIILSSANVFIEMVLSCWFYSYAVKISWINFLFFFFLSYCCWWNTAAWVPDLFLFSSLYSGGLLWPWILRIKVWILRKKYDTSGSVRS